MQEKKYIILLYNIIKCERKIRGKNPHYFDRHASSLCLYSAIHSNTTLPCTLLFPNGLSYFGITESENLKKRRKKPFLFTRGNMCACMETIRKQRRGKLSISHYAETLSSVHPCSCSFFHPLLPASVLKLALHHNSVGVLSTYLLILDMSELNS